MTCHPTCQSDLVFTVLGGARHGQNLPIKTQKCILAFDDNSGIQHPTRCAIFRGEAGVTLRNLDSRVLVNGELKPLHWLQTGDRIEFPSSVVLEVAQLGTVVLEMTTEPAPSPTAFQDSIETFSPAFDQVPAPFGEEPAWTSNSYVEDPAPSLFTERNVWDDLHQVQPDSPSETHPERWADESQSSFPEEITQSELNRLSEPPVSASVESRFHEIEARLNQLADQISSLVTLASCGKFSSTALPETEFEDQLTRSAQTHFGSISTAQPNQNPEPAVSSSDAWAPASKPNARFNVADFGSQAPPESIPWRETPAAAPADSEVSTEVDSPTARTNATVAQLPSHPDPLQSTASTFDPAVLNPIRRQPDQSESAAPNPASLTGVDEGLSQLLQSLKDEVHQPVASTATETSEQPWQPSPVAPSDSDSESALENSMADLASRFSTSAALETPSVAVPERTSVPNESTALSEKPSPRAVEDEIDAMLSRLFNKPMQTTASPSPPASSPSLPSFSEPQSALPEWQPPASESAPADRKFGFDAEGQPNDRAIDLSQAAAQATQTAQAALPGSESGVPVASPELAGTGSAAAQTEASVMDVLARLKQQGCWDESDKTSAPEIESIIAAAEVRLAHQIDPTESTLSHAEPLAEIAEPSTDCVEDYMTKLLARMQIGSDHVAETKPKTSSQNAAAPTPLPSEPRADLSHDADLMTPEEFIPKQKAAKPQSFDTMREIANTTARTAVAYSDLDRKKARGLMQLIIAVGALIMSAYYLLFVSEAVGDTAFVLGFVCLLGSAGASFLGFKTLQTAGVLKHSFRKNKPE